MRGIREDGSFRGNEWKQQKCQKRGAKKEMVVNRKKMWKATGGIREREETGGVEGQSIMVLYQ